ncbi:MAG TPA: exo-alpha-sialidase [bacterium (Candidatus Stahlbacteria)]|nr:exo-alpha-sialidase [Candidatus Stahlbacteria bacterium]
MLGNKIFVGLGVILMSWVSLFAPPQGWDQWQHFPSTEDQSYPILSGVRNYLGTAWLYQGFVQGTGLQRELWFRRSGDFGFHWENPIRLDNSGRVAGYDRNYDLTRGSWGYIFAVWSEFQPGPIYQLWFSYSTDYGVTWTSPTRIDDDLGIADPNYPYYPSLYVDDLNNLHLAVYYHNDPNDPEIGYSRYNTSTNTWEPYECVYSHPLVFTSPEIITAGP